MSFDSFALLARVAGPAALMDILDPLKEMMKTTVTMKVCHEHLTSLSSVVKSYKTCIGKRTHFRSLASIRSILRKSFETLGTASIAIPP